MIRKFILILALILILAGCSKEEKVNEALLWVSYFELVESVNELFKNHTRVGEEYFNQLYKNKVEVSRLLADKVTEEGLEQIIDSIFETEDQILVYKDEFKEYLDESNLYSRRSNNMSNYYPTVRETILNPGLKIVSSEEFKIEESEDVIILVGENVPITFYHEEDQLNGRQFQRFGYPATDYINISFSFIYEDGRYLLDEYEIEVTGG